MATPQKQDATGRAKATRPQPIPMQPEAPSMEAIAARAYEIWQANGCLPGSDAENWFQAERELRARKAR